MKRLNNKKGFTLAELLIVVAIIVILAGITFIALPRYMRIFRQLEYDNTAKEIFIAAQNHLAMAENEGYLDIDQFGNEEIESEKQTGAYYFVVNNSNVSSVFNTNSALKLMLPIASIDDTIRLKGSYIVRYDKNNAKVLDVFYTNENDATYGRTFVAEDYTTLMGLRDVYANGELITDNKLNRRNHEGKVIGWYGGEDVEKSPTTIEAPLITVENKDELKVIAERLTPESKIRIVLIGKTSGAEAYVPESMVNESENTFTCTLDSISSGRFYTLFSDFIPGENISVQAVAYNNNVLSNIAYSSTLITNSLFADGSTEDTAYITYFRHLENLDKAKSNFDSNDTGNKLNIANAVQLTDLDWSKVTKSLYNNKYDTVNIDYPLSFDGKDHLIKNLSVTGDNDNGGVFGLIDSGDDTKTNTFKNLRIVDLSFANSSLNTGDLAGTVRRTNIESIYAYCSSGSTYSSSMVSGSNAGGLIGVMYGKEVSNSGAALRVDATGTSDGYGNAGGLIGMANGVTIKKSYSGGHTNNGKYDNINGNVSGRIAGGLVGNSISSIIDTAYSTCSVNGNNISGGLVGKTSSTAIKNNSYCTGKIFGYASTKGLFVGESDNASSLAGWYLLIPNYSYSEGLNICDSTVNTDEILQIDKDLTNYRNFLGYDGTNSPYTAYVYDSQLLKTYNSTYPLVAVTSTNEHYGDFPTYETIIVNN